MAEELIIKLDDNSSTNDKLSKMFDHNKEGSNDFPDALLNSSGKSIRSKVLPSKDFFSKNASVQGEIKTQFDNWTKVQVDEVFPKWDTDATSRNPGKLEAEDKTRHVNTKGMEYIQIIKKSLRSHDAFTLGRATIVNKNYEERDKQANIIRENISKVIAVRTAHYSQSEKDKLSGAGEKKSAFHDLSEVFGFMYSLQVNRKPNSKAPYFTRQEVKGFTDKLEVNNGFWEITSAYIA
ncbi:DUF4856 domain-containing protein [Elysia marginata]|uniref:DUF4856 domain-containing protein n=1 Tax=Elysia marginata TaxID=1093978 RepID=A0AAV4F0M0_9GAST|nr:DUF4856 domain-containing protein [Elysia marginata]